MRETNGETMEKNEDPPRSQVAQRFILRFVYVLVSVTAVSKIQILKNHSPVAIVWPI